MNYRNVYDEWISNPYFDSETKEELLTIAENEQEIEERFYKELEFGTGGLRGVIGAGTNRMNIYSVRKATQGLANYLKKTQKDAENKKVAIAYDSRHMSPEFAKEAACVFAANGICTYVFESLRPTPELSFAVRQLECVAGIVITASHNPAEYNGYKVYGADGGQVPPPFDQDIIEEVLKIESFSQVFCTSQQEAEQKGLLKWIGKEIDDLYINEVKKQSIHPEIIKEVAKEFTVVYTPLHGTGNIPVRRVLDEMGFENVYVVPEQEMPDSEFSTVSYPNPEDPKAFQLAIKLAKEKNADIIIGTDPDADRVGVLVRNNQGEYEVLTGNMTGVLLTEYVLSQRQAVGKLPSNGALIKTIVTTEMAREIAKTYGVELIEVLTGFKFIGEKIRLFEQDNSYEYLFGFEESYGYLAGTYARDKDAVVASMLACELAAYYKSQEMTLYEGLQSLYEKYGYYKESLEAVTLKGMAGMKKIQNVMDNMRQEEIKHIGGYDVVAKRDYKTKVITDLKTGKEELTNLPTSNVLYFQLENNAWFCVRPSGTEPKVKLYFGVKGNGESEAVKKLETLKKAVMDTVSAWM